MIFQNHGFLPILLFIVTIFGVLVLLLFVAYRSAARPESIKILGKVPPKIYPPRVMVTIEKMADGFLLTLKNDPAHMKWQSSVFFGNEATLKEFIKDLTEKAEAAILAPPKS